MLRLPFLLAARGASPAHHPAAGAGESPSRLLLLLTRQFAGVALQDLSTRKKHAVFYSRITRKLAQLGVEPSMAAIDQAIGVLTEILGVNETKALQAISLHPNVLAYSPETIARKINWLRENGSTVKQVGTMVFRHPNLLGLRTETMEAMRKWYIDQGVPPEKIPFVFSVFPQVLSTSATNNLDQKVELLRSYGLEQKHIASILSRMPQAFSKSVEGLEKNIRFLLKHCVSQEDLPKVLAITPESMSITTKNIKSTLVMLEAMFGPEKARYMLSTRSRVLICNRKELRRSYNFLVELGIPPERIARDLAIAMRNKDNLLKPRAEFLKETGALEASMETVHWIKDSYPAFVKRFPAYEEYAQQRGSH